MKIHRAPKKGRSWVTITDSRVIKDDLKGWSPEQVIEFDGTMTGKAKRQTAIGVQLDPEDISALATVLFEHYETRQKALENALREVALLLQEERGPTLSGSAISDLRRIMKPYHSLAFRFE